MTKTQRKFIDRESEIEREALNEETAKAVPIGSIKGPTTCLDKIDLAKANLPAAVPNFKKMGQEVSRNLWNKHIFKKQTKWYNYFGRKVGEETARLGYEEGFKAGERKVLEESIKYYEASLASLSSYLPKDIIGQTDMEKLKNFYEAQLVLFRRLLSLKKGYLKQ